MRLLWQSARRTRITAHCSERISGLMERILSTPTSGKRSNSFAVSRLALFVIWIKASLDGTHAAASHAPVLPKRRRRFSAAGIGTKECFFDRPKAQVGPASRVPSLAIRVAAFRRWLPAVTTSFAQTLRTVTKLLSGAAETRFSWSRYLYALRRFLRDIHCNLPPAWQ